MLSLFFLVVLILGLSLCFVDLAYSIPTSQQDCEAAGETTSSTTLVVLPNSTVTVNDGGQTRNCVISFSSEAVASVDDFIQIGYL